MANRIAVVLVVMTMAWVPRPADACSCRPPVPACQGTWEHDAVFVGQVRQSVRVGDRDVVDFDVLEAFRGVVPGHVTLSTPFGTCTFAFEKGRTYLVYAHRDGRNLATSTCSGTKAVEAAAEDLIYLRAVATMKPRATGDLRVRTGTAESPSAARPTRMWCTWTRLPVTSTRLASARSRCATREAAWPRMSS